MSKLERVQSRPRNHSDEMTPDTLLPMRSFAHSLPMALLATRENVMSHFRPLLREYGVTEQQWRVLRALVETNRIEVTELARRSYILSPSLSRILHNLVERGLATRSSVAADQRRALIAITKKGRDLVDTIAPHSEQHYATIEATFGKDKLALLFTQLAELNAALGRNVNGGQA
jgi:homoprotocatechuate degradation regulator HpaR